MGTGTASINALCTVLLTSTTQKQVALLPNKFELSADLIREEGDKVFPLTVVQLTVL